jgi:hypothetical protein
MTMLAGNKALDQAIYRKPKYSWYNSNPTYGTITACLLIHYAKTWILLQTDKTESANILSRPL